MFWRLMFIISVIGFIASVFIYVMTFFLPVSGFYLVYLQLSFGRIIALFLINLIWIFVLALLSAAKWWRVFSGDKIYLPNETPPWMIVGIFVLFILAFTNGILASISSNKSEFELVTTEQGRPFRELLTNHKEYLNELSNSFQMMADNVSDKYAFRMLNTSASVLMLFYWSCATFFAAKIENTWIL